jgi:hypothetical protein
MVSLEFFIDIILLVALWPWGRLSLEQKWVPGVFPGDKGGRCVRLTTLPSSCAVVMQSGNLNFLEPSGPLQASNGTASFVLNRENFYNFNIRRITIKSFLNVLCFVDHASRCNRVKKNQLDAQLIVSMFRQPVPLPLFRPIISRYNRMYTTIGTCYSF